MAKRLCKWNRHDISTSLGEIHHLVREAKFVCRACARSAHHSSSLCKPLALPTISVKKRHADSVEQPLLKLSKKQLKQQKANKKLKKLVAKQSKLLKKSQRLAREIAFNARLNPGFVEPQREQDNSPTDRQTH